MSRSEKASQSDVQSGQPWYDAIPLPHLVVSDTGSRGDGLLVTKQRLCPKLRRVIATDELRRAEHMTAGVVTLTYAVRS